MAMGLIAWGGLGGAGNAVAQQSSADLDQQRRLDYAKQVGDMDQARQQAVMQYGQGLQQQNAQFSEDLRMKSDVARSDPNGPLATNQRSLLDQQRLDALNFTTSHAAEIGAATGTTNAAATVAAATPEALAATRKEADAKTTMAERARAGLESAQTSSITGTNSARADWVDAVKKFGSDSAQAKEKYEVMLGLAGQGRSRADDDKLLNTLQTEIKNTQASLQSTDFMTLPPDQQAAQKRAATARIQTLTDQMDDLMGNIRGKRGLGSGDKTPAGNVDLNKFVPGGPKAASSAAIPTAAAPPGTVTPPSGPQRQLSPEEAAQMTALFGSTVGPVYQPPAAAPPVNPAPPRTSILQ